MQNHHSVNRVSAIKLLGCSLLGLSVAACELGNSAPNTNYRESLYFPVTTQTVTLDGEASEVAWDDAFDYRLEDGVATPDVFMKGVTDADDIYFYFQAEDEQDIFDHVILAFNPDGDPANYHRIDIQPCSLVDSGGNPTFAPCTPTPGGLDPKVTYYTGSLSGTEVNWTATTTAPTGLEIKSNYVSGSMGVSPIWSAEIKLPKSSYTGFPASDKFAMFATTLTVDQVNISTATEYSWPAGTLIYQPNLAAAVLDTQRWGNASLDPSTASPGLQVTGFSTNQANPGQMALDQSNEFFATVGNLSAGGVPPATANGVNATFKIANFGLPSGTSWTDIPSATNPTGSANIAADDYRLFQSGLWTLSTTNNWAGSGQSELDFFTDHPHQCVKVEIADPGGVLFTRQYNLDFVIVNSPFKSSATIDLAGWKEQVAGAQQIVLEESFANLGRLQWKSQFEGLKKSGERSWTIPLDDIQKREQRLDMIVDPDDRLRIPSKVFALGNDPTRMGVKPGSVVTLLVDEPQKQRRRSGNGDEKQRSLVSPQTVVASFDGFETSFAIGSGQTFIVPANTSDLQIRYVGEQKLEEPLVAQMILTGATPAVRQVMPYYRALKGREAPVFLPLAINLPFHYVRGKVVTDRQIIIEGEKFFEAMPMGSFAHPVRSVGPVQVN